MEEVVVRKDYKDRLFRFIFQEKKELLSLYNAINDTDYTDETALEIVTLENAIYMNMKNDLAFILGFYLNLYEHQSTFNPNMPLRDLIYISKELEGMIDKKKLYGSTLVHIPTPRFVVFYNGTDEQPERQVLKLSDAFQIPESEPQLEVLVTMLNINLGKNQELASKCQRLKEYVIYTDRVRTYMRKMDLSDAVERAVDECIKEDVLKEFLMKYRKEAIALSIFEYDEEEVMQYLREEATLKGLEEGRKKGLEEGREEGRAEGRAEGREEGRAEGREEGRAEGRAEGSERINRLNAYLGEQDRVKDILRAASDREYQKKLLEEYDSLQKEKE